MARPPRITPVKTASIPVTPKTVATGSGPKAAAAPGRSRVRLKTSCAATRPRRAGGGGAAAAAAATASKSLRDLRVAEVLKLDVIIEDGKVSAYRARINISFKYESDDGGG